MTYTRTAKHTLTQVGISALAASLVIMTGCSDKQQEAIEELQGSAAGMVESSGNIDRGTHPDATLVASSEDQSTWDKTKEASSEAWEDTKDAAGETWDKTKEVSGDAWDKTKEVSEETWDKTKEVSEETWDKTKEEVTSPPDPEDPAQVQLEDR